MPAFSVRLRCWCIRLVLIGGLGLEPSSSWRTVAGLIAVISQATILGIVTLWIATRQSRVSRVIGGLILALLSIALMYAWFSDPMWKVNVLIVATIALTWIFGRQRKKGRGGRRPSA